MHGNTAQRLERRILWGVVFLDLLVLAVALFSLLHSRAQSLQAMQETSHNLAQLLEQRIAGKARLVDDAVVRVERELECQLHSGGIDAGSLLLRLGQEQERLPEIDAIRVTNPQGEILWGKGIAPGVKASYADRAFFKAHLESHSHVSIVSPPLKGQVSGLWIIAFTRSYHTPDGSFGGIVSAEVPMGTFARLLSTVNPGPNGTAVIRYSDAGLIARMPPLKGAAGDPGNKNAPKELISLLASGKPAADFRLPHTPDGGDRAYAFRRVQNLPFTIAVGLEENEYLLPWRIQAVWGFILLAVLLMVTSALARVMIRYVREQGLGSQEHERDLTRRRILIDESRDGIVVLDQRGKVWEANKRFAEMLGYSPEEIQELYVWDWDAQWSRQELEEMATKVDAGGDHFETRHRRKDGRVFAVEISTNGAYFGDNKLIFCVCRDISERNQARDALRVSEEKYRIIFENQLYAVAIFDLDTHLLLDVNDAFVQLYGYSRDELLDGMTILDLSAEPDKSMAAMQQSAEQGSIFIPSCCQRKKGGTIVAVEVVGGSYVWNGRRVMFILAHDISDRKKAEDELREREALYRFLVTSLNDGFFACDAQGIVTFANAAMAAMLGLADPASLLGRHIFEHVIPADLQRVETYFSEAVTRRIVPRSLEVVLAREDGEKFWVEIKPTVVTCDQGGMSIQGLVIDITQRKKDAEALRKSEERMHLALQATRDAVWDWDLQAGTLYYSPRWFLMVGYTPGELQADPDLWRRLLHPDDLERADRAISEAIAGKTFFEIETRFRHKAGHDVPVLTRGYVLRDDSGKAIRLAGTNADLSEQKRIEEERRKWERQASQLRKAESLSRMAGAIAHHFNNLLTVVLGNIELSLEDLPADEPVTANLQAASRAGGRAVEVSSLLLTYLGQAEGRHELIDLGQLFRQNLPQLQALLAEQVVLETRFPATGPLVHGNGSHLQRMVKNLVVNAVEAIGEGQGTIGLSLIVVPLNNIPSHHRFPLDWKPTAGHYACLRVQDSGEGIEPDDIEQLFDPFFSSKFTGRGLGLSVVMGIVRSHAGGITVESTRSRGSIFRVYLPLAEPQSLPEQKGAGDESIITDDRTVLLVDDEEQVRTITEFMLNRLGFSCLSAGDGAEGLDLFTQHADRIDLVICDLTMPTMGGWETMEAIRAIAPAVPLVMISGYDETQVMGEGRKHYPQAFLQKPFRKDELAAAIEAACKPLPHCAGLQRETVLP